MTIQTIEQQVIDDAVTFITTTISKLNELNDELSDYDNSDIVKQLSNYKEFIEQLDVDNKVLVLIDDIMYISLAYDWSFEIEHDRHITSLTFNHIYCFNYRNSNDLEHLCHYLKYLSNVIPSLNNLTDNKAINVVMDNNTNVIPIPEVYVGISSIEVDEDIELKKIQNIQHLKKVKANIDNKNTTSTNQKLKDRELVFKNFLDAQVNIHEFKDFVRTWLLDPVNDKVMTVLEFSEYARLHVKGIQQTTARILIELVIVNLSNNIVKFSKFNINNKPLYVQIPMLDKECFTALILSNLDIVTNHIEVFDITVEELTVNMVDFSNKNSSLAIVETPEELVQLIDGIYGVLLSKKLDPKYVYSVDVNSQYDVPDSKWFINNKAIKYYVNELSDYFDESKSTTNKIVNDITNIVNSRDTMMSTSSLTHDALIKLFKALELLVDYSNNVGGTYNGTTVISGVYNVYQNDEMSTRPVNVIITEECACVIIEVSEGSYMHEFYSESTTIKLVRWLDYLLNQRRI